MMQGNQKPFDDVGTLASLAKLVSCPAPDHVNPVLDKQP